MRKEQWQEYRPDTEHLWPRWERKIPAQKCPNCRRYEFTQWRTRIEHDFFGCNISWKLFCFRKNEKGFWRDDGSRCSNCGYEEL